ncbi:MAG: hypothetical protein ABIO02_02735 [Patescibacteria group bacterium]
MDKDKPDDIYGDFWLYLSKPQQDLILEGDYLLNNIIKQSPYSFQDYSFLVFPYAKAYEGYLKMVFFDAGFISHLDYISDHLRLGKLMSPNIAERLGERSLYFKIKKHVNVELADMVWDGWRLGRNEIFHYFPHNLRSISFTQAEAIISQLLRTMEQTYIGLKPLLKHDPHSVQS